LDLNPQGFLAIELKMIQRELEGLTNVLLKDKDEVTIDDLSDAPMGFYGT
jgi:hypothetical protein